jgi:hypothetical protein
MHGMGEYWHDEQYTSVNYTIHVIAGRERNADRDANAINHNPGENVHRQE